jgi:hypothetical protein
MLVANLCYEWKCLPNAGGLFDQDPLHIAVLTAYTAAVAEKQNRESKKGGGHALRRA